MKWRLVSNISVGYAAQSWPLDIAFLRILCLRIDALIKWDITSICVTYSSNSPVVFASGFIIVTKDWYKSAVSNHITKKGLVNIGQRKRKDRSKKIEKIISNMHEPYLYPYMTHRLEEWCTHIRNTSNSRRKSAY